ncbi:DNA recombination protein RmuC [Calidifontibacter terrae]
MTVLIASAALLVGLLLGAAFTLLTLRARYEGRHAAAVTERDLLRARVDTLEGDLGDDQLTAQALGPLSSSIARIERQVATLERDRVDQFSSLDFQLQAVTRTTTALHRETSQLAGALKSSNVSGAWGEVQLRRVLEHSGMLPRCDFEEQVRAVSRHGADIRPDVVVRLPGDKVIVIDAKAPIQHFLAAQSEDLDEGERRRLLRTHAAALRGHVEALAAKDYWSGFSHAPEVVLCFVPSEAVLAAAARSDADLLDRALARNVVVVSPGSLLATLQATALVWRQDSLESGAAELLTLGRELYERLGTLGRHTQRMGDQLRKSVETYNALVGTLESRVFVSARRIEELGMVSGSTARVEPVDATPRPLTAAELLDRLDDDVRRPELDLDFPSTGGSASSATG